MVGCEMTAFRNATEYEYEEGKELKEEERKDVRYVRRRRYILFISAQSNVPKTQTHGKYDTLLSALLHDTDKILMTQINCLHFFLKHIHFKVSFRGYDTV